MSKQFDKVDVIFWTVAVIFLSPYLLVLFGAVGFYRFKKGWRDAKPRWTEQT